MKFVTDKSKVMFRPHDLNLELRPPAESDAIQSVPAEVRDRINLGWFIKYELLFEAGVVSEGWEGAGEGAAACGACAVRVSMSV